VAVGQWGIFWNGSNLAKNSYDYSGICRGYDPESGYMDKDGDYYAHFVPGTLPEPYMTIVANAEAK
jgi:hypothetical protein